MTKAVGFILDLRERVKSHRYRDLQHLNIYGDGTNGKIDKDTWKMIQSLSEVNEKIIIQEGILISVMIMKWIGLTVFLMYCHSN